MARRRKPANKRRGKGSTDSASSQPSSSLEQVEADLSLHAGGEADAWSSSLGPPQDSGSETVRRRRSRKGTEEEEEGEEAEGLLRLPEMTDTSMESVGQPLRDMIDRLDGGEVWERLAAEEEEGGEGGGVSLFDCPVFKLQEPHSKGIHGNYSNRFTG